MVTGDPNGKFYIYQYIVKYICEVYSVALPEFHGIPRVPPHCSGPGAQDSGPKAPAQVPVRAFSARAGNAPCAMARFTAEKIANRDAVMILGCIPAPNKVRRDRVVISI